jgi:hypothetical protein
VPRVNFRELSAPWSEIDGVFDGCRLDFGEQDFYRLRLTPWSEHPLYVAARKKKYPAAYDTDGRVDHVTVFPLGLRQVRLHRSHGAVRLVFVERGPRMWEHETTGKIFVNGPVAADVLVDAVARRLEVSRMELATTYVTVASCASQASYALCLPASIHAAAVAALDELGVDHWVAEAPAKTRLPVILRLGAGELIADDFEVEVPDLELRAAPVTAAHISREAGKNAKRSRGIE